MSLEAKQQGGEDEACERDMRWQGWDMLAFPGKALIEKAPTNLNPCSVMHAALPRKLAVAV